MTEKLIKKADNLNYYQKELHRLRGILYKNQSQIDAVIAIKNYIHINYQKDLNLDLLSKIQFISKYHLIRLFRRYYGQTPRQYLIDVRVKKAKEFLAKGSTVSDTCNAVGFTSLGSFSMLFKTKTGMNPAQYQKEQLSRKNFPAQS